MSRPALAACRLYALSRPSRGFRNRTCSLRVTCSALPVADPGVGGPAAEQDQCGRGAQGGGGAGVRGRARGRHQPRNRRALPLALGCACPAAFGLHQDLLERDGTSKCVGANVLAKGLQDLKGRTVVCIYPGGHRGPPEWAAALSAGMLKATPHARRAGDAEAILRRAEATAKGLAVVAEAMADRGGADAAALRVAEQYVSAFGQVAKLGTTVLLPAAVGDPAAMVAQALAIYRSVGPRRSVPRPHCLGYLPACWSMPCMAALALHGPHPRLLTQAHVLLVSRMCATTWGQASSVHAAGPARERRRKAAAAPYPRPSVALPAAAPPLRSGLSLAPSRAAGTLATVRAPALQRLATSWQALPQAACRCSVCRGTRECDLRTGLHCANTWDAGWLYCAR